MLIFLSGNKVIGWIPNKDLTEERKEEILAERENAVWIDEEIRFPDDAKTYTVRYIDGVLVYEEQESPTPQTIEERLTEAEKNISTLSEYSADLLYQVCLLQLGLTDEEI